MKTKIFLISMASIALLFSCSEDLKKENKKLKNQLQESQTSLSESQAQALDNEKKLTDSQQKIHRIEEEKAQTQTLLTDLEKDLSGKASDIETLLQSLDQKRIEFLNLKKSHTFESSAHEETKKQLLQLADDMLKISSELQAKKREKILLETELAKQKSSFEKMERALLEARTNQKSTQDEMEKIQQENEELKDKLAQSLPPESEERDRMARVLKDTLDGKAGIYVLQAKITPPSGEDCYKIVEIQSDGKINLALACASGAVEVLKAHLTKFESTFMPQSLKGTGLILEIKADQSCPNSLLTKHEKVIIDRGQFDLAVLDTEMLFLEEGDKTVSLMTVAMLGFVQPTPPLDFARTIAGLYNQSPLTVSVVNYIEKSVDSTKAGCFDENLQFKPHTN